MRIRWAGYAWIIEYYHRGIKQFCGIERAQAFACAPSANHIGLVFAGLPAFESHCYRTESIGLKRNHQHSGCRAGLFGQPALYLGSNRVTSKIFENYCPRLYFRKSPRYRSHEI